MQQTSVLSDESFHAATSSSSSSDESDIDRTLEDRSRALPASLSPEGTASQEVTTQESYGGQCLAMRD